MQVKLEPQNDSAKTLDDLGPGFYITSVSNEHRVLILKIDRDRVIGFDAKPDSKTLTAGIEWGWRGDLRGIAISNTIQVEVESMTVREKL